MVVPGTILPQKGRSSQSILIERHEAKYIIDPSLVPAIREFIEPFCSMDPNCQGDPPEYVITTLQLDTPRLSLHHAKDFEAVTRFKLRARAYGLDGKSPVYVEIKRKHKGLITKSRAKIPRNQWCKELVLDPTRRLNIHFRSSEEDVAFLEFVRISREIGAVPVVLVRYTRESYVSRVDDYARVTFDRKLLYQPTNSWNLDGHEDGWRTIDSSLEQNKGGPFSGVILEIKTLPDVPTWVLDLTEEFDLVRTGNCKYCSAVWVESLFRGVPTAPGYATDLLTC